MTGWHPIYATFSYARAGKNLSVNSYLTLTAFLRVTEKSIFQVATCHTGVTPLRGNASFEVCFQTFYQCVESFGTAFVVLPKNVGQIDAEYGVIGVQLGGFATQYLLARLAFDVRLPANLVYTQRLPVFLVHHSD